MNRQQRLASRPAAEPTVENFRLVEVPVPDLHAGQVLVRHHFLSLDPYMRGRMNEGKSYAAPQPLDEVMIGGTAGEVVATMSDRFAVGDRVVGMGGWQQYQVVDAAQAGMLRKVDTSKVPLSAYLGPVGMPGVTGWYGLVRIIAPKAGETVVVSAASGAVGGVVGQLAKLRGARAVGIAGGPEKCAWLVDELGFDAAIDYKAGPIGRRLHEECPKGIDIYFDNVGGEILDACLGQLALHARVVCCGAISAYNDRSAAYGLTNYFSLITRRARMEGFLILDYQDRFG